MALLLASQPMAGTGFNASGPSQAGGRKSQGHDTEDGKNTGDVRDAYRNLIDI